ncbi:MAG: hypothetical protein M1405_03625 [Patescibacteria group bacterium]|nr:hypothetical protein [Patescibacteria group bacterium]
MSDEDLLEIESSKSRFSFKNVFTARKLMMLFFTFLFLNVIYIDLLLIQGTNKQTIIQRFESITNQVPEKTVASPSPDICPQSCVSQIQQAINLTKPSATVSPTPTSVNNSSSQTTSSSQTKEYYVPFGSGSGSSGDWADVPGLSASVDSGSYGAIKNVVFEASLHIPTGNETVSVRLYNATDGHPVWNSELNFNGNTNSVLGVSPSVSLDSGNKLYKVQMKTQLQFTAILDQSRLHITTR